jgi:hypothetical protein
VYTVYAVNNTIIIQTTDRTVARYYLSLAQGAGK